ncbi:MAG TPA: PLD nuclease N-terminal domain-containing protein [Dictyobacter sp.]|jgi:hypothetical protein|nr:PLD nuclease N-terminal domain-containing protein [Dictyobacter sp.]
MFGAHSAEWLILLFTIVWIGMLIDCFSNKSLNTPARILWAIVILFGSIVGAVIYFFMVFIKHFSHSDSGGLRTNAASFWTNRDKL